MTLCRRRQTQRLGVDVRRQAVEATDAELERRAVVQRYFFHTEDGRSFHDEEGTPLANDDAARIEAARVLGQLISDHPAAVWLDDAFRLTVTDQSGITLFILDIAAVTSPVVGGAKPRPGRA